MINVYDGFIMNELQFVTVDSLSKLGVVIVYIHMVYRLAYIVNMYKVIQVVYILWLP